MRSSLTLMTLTLGAASAACHPDVVLARRGRIEVTGATATPSIGDAGIAYFRIRNMGPGADTLASVRGPAMARADLMGTTGGRMFYLAPPILLPGHSLEMAPGGIHVMLSRLPREYVIGDTIPLVLEFKVAGALAMQIPVRPLGARW